MAAGIGEALLAAGQELKGFGGKMREQAAAQTKAQQNRAVMEAANLVVYAQNPTEAQLQDAITKLSAIDSPIAREVVAAGRERLQTMGNEKRRTDMLTVPGGRPKISVSAAPSIGLQPITLPGVAPTTPAEPPEQPVAETLEPTMRRISPAELPPEQQIEFASIPGGAPILNSALAVSRNQQQIAEDRQKATTNAAKAEQKATIDAAKKRNLVIEARAEGYPYMESLEDPAMSADDARQAFTSWRDAHVVRPGQGVSLEQGQERLNLSREQFDAQQRSAIARTTSAAIGALLKGYSPIPSTLDGNTKSARERRWLQAMQAARVVARADATGEAMRELNRTIGSLNSTIRGPAAISRDILRSVIEKARAAGDTDVVNSAQSVLNGMGQ